MDFIIAYGLITAIAAGLFVLGVLLFLVGLVDAELNLWNIVKVPKPGPKTKPFVLVLGFLSMGASIYLAKSQGVFERGKRIDARIEISGDADRQPIVFFPDELLKIALKGVEAEKVLWIVDEEKLIPDNHEHRSTYTFKQGKSEHRIDAFFKIDGTYQSVKHQITLGDRKEYEGRFPVSRSYGLPNRIFVDPADPMQLIECIKTNNGKVLCNPIN